MLSHWIGNAESEMVFQQITHGHVDYGEAVLSGVLEPIAGPISGKIAGPGTQTLLSRGIEAGNPRLRDGQLPLGNITRAPQRRNLPRASRRRNTQRCRLRRHHRHDRRKNIRRPPRLNTHRTLRTP
ncbi:hypothetical protein HMPREF9573_00432 [Cutibacterium acnes HL072PA2]|nr:hypothetical protein HMPREF9573_00432 [Cutibacterium acnes HL072PA2]